MFPLCDGFRLIYFRRLLTAPSNGIIALLVHTLYRIRQAFGFYLISMDCHYIDQTAERLAGQNTTLEERIFPRVPYFVHLKKHDMRIPICHTRVPIEPIRIAGSLAGRCREATQYFIYILLNIRAT